MNTMSAVELLPLVQGLPSAFNATKEDVPTGELNLTTTGRIEASDAVLKRSLPELQD